MQWNWRIVAYAGVMCAMLSCCGMLMGVFGEREGFYLGFGGFIGLCATTIAVTIDYLERRKR